MAAKVPFELIGDPGRLKALDSYAILDTPPEQGFDDIVQLACLVCDKPAALISLVASDRQWFKARLGVDACQMPVAQSICAHALGQDDLLIIPDLTQDPRTRANPIVTGEPHIRFYAGAPLTTAKGETLGTLCVIDFVPHPEGLNPAQAAALAALGRQVIQLLEARRALHSHDKALALLKSSEANLRAIVETVPVGIMFAEAPSGRIVGRNGRMREIVGHDGQASKTMSEYGDWVAFQPDGRRVAASEFPLARVIAGNLDQANLQAQYQRRDGTRIWIDINAAAVRAEDGTLKGAVVAVSNIDARKNAEARQLLLNDELSHRMKNLMALVQAVAHQTLRGTSSLAVAREELNDRLVALGKAHDILLGGVAMRASIESVVRGEINIASQESRIRYKGPEIEISAKATLALGMMLHELTTNAIKYGALSTEDGYVDLVWSLSPGDTGEPRLRIEWRETGGPPVASPQRKGFGTKLIERGLSGQVGGSTSLTYEAEGVVCRVEAFLAAFQRDD